MDLAHLKGWIGRVEESTDILTPRLAQTLQATIGDEAAPFEEGAVAPLAAHWCLSPPAAPTGALGEDGHPARGGFLPPVPLPRRMWAGGRLRLLDPLRVGDRVVRTSTIADVTLKEGRSGRLCFVAVDHALATDRGVAIEERQDIVYRDAGPAPAAAAAAATPSGLPIAAWTRQMAANPVLLFRYSALTFNGHRIHYDRDYAMRQEGYPGLVVHGPLQATLLLNLAASVRDGRMPTRFTFKSVGPLFDGGPLMINGAPAEEGLRLWTSGADGRAAMEAAASWSDEV